MRGEERKKKKGRKIPIGGVKKTEGESEERRKEGRENEKVN